MSRPRLSSQAYSVAWISALPIESAAAAEILDQEHDVPEDYSENAEQHVFGRIGNHNVLLARLPSGRMGNNSAAAVAARLTTLFPSIRFALLVGIGGGVPSASVDIRLGDVVIGHPHLQHSGVVQYDFGKTNADGLMRTGSLDAPPTIFLNAIAKMREDHYRDRANVSKHLAMFDRLPRFRRNSPDVLFKPAYKHAGGDTCEDCDMGMSVQRVARTDEEEVVIHFGTIASGNQVMKDGITRDRLSTELGGGLCFEMEASGLASTFPCVVVRGVCDYADSHKNKDWQPYAAATAAAVSKDMLLLVPAAPKSLIRSIQADLGSEKYRIPFSLKRVPIGRFANQPDDMYHLERVLLPSDEKEPCRRKILVLQGLGGIGKTQLAVEFACKYQSTFTSVFWVDGSSENSLKQSIAEGMGRIRESQAGDIGMKHSSDLDGEHMGAVRDFLEWISKMENKYWLLVFDNVDRDYQQGTDADAYDVRDYFPNVDHGSVLVTTRLSNLTQLGEYLHLRNVDLDQAKAIFRKWYGQEFDFSESEELLQLLGGLPLALAQAATYMSETGASFDTYTKLYKEQWKDLMEDDDMAPLEAYKNRSINTTWTVSYNAIRERNKSAANLLLLWAHLDNKTLPFSLLRAQRRWSEKGLPEWFNDTFKNEMQFLRIVRLLLSYCLIESIQGSSNYSIHPVVHQWAFHIQNDNQKKELSRLAVLIIGFAVPRSIVDVDHNVRQQLYSHADAWFERGEGAEVKMTGDEETDRQHIFALRGTGALLYVQGRFSKSKIILQRTLASCEKVLGPDDLELLNLFTLLGITCSRLSHFVEGEKMLQRALQGYMDLRGPDDPLTLDAYSQLGRLYDGKGDSNEAIKVFEHVIEVRKKIMGPDSDDILDVMWMLGGVYARQGQLTKARTMCTQVLEGFERTVGAEKMITRVPAVLALFEFGILCQDEGRMSEARDLYVRAKKGIFIIYGARHHLYQSVCNRLQYVESCIEHPGSSSPTVFASEQRTELR